MQQNYRFQLLAPAHTPSVPAFGRPKVNEQLYYHYLASMQKLRGRVYVEDGAVQRWELDEDGRFCIRGDEQSWHFLLIDAEENTIGCARYLVHPNTVPVEALRIWQSPLARHGQWGEKLRQAVSADLQRARQDNLAYVEIGGWALSEQWRGTRAALEILVASYALAHLWGGCLGACMATARHHSSSILRRIGGSSFHFGDEAIPPYDDPHYGCKMEMLRFDSRSPAQRFIPLINQLRAKVGNTAMLQRAGAPAWGRVARQSRAEHVGMVPVPVSY